LSGKKTADLRSAELRHLNIGTPQAAIVHWSQAITARRIVQTKTVGLL